jgi:hypothetical protein
MTHEEWMLAQAPVIEWSNMENFNEWSNIWNELSGNIPPAAAAS